MGLLSISFRSLFLLLALPLLLNAESGFYSTKAYRVPSAIEQAGYSVVKILIIDSARQSFLSSGSGFVVDDGKTIWTAAHVVAGAGIDINNLQIQLQDNLGRTVFDTTRGDSVSVTLLGSSRDFSNQSRDFAKLILSRPLALRPIPINSSSPSVGQDLYSVGFPAISSLTQVTEISVLEGVPQSRVTMGKAIHSAGSTILMDSDGYFGQSGSPILNESGEAVGIFTSIFTLNGSRPNERNTRGGMGPSFSGILAP